MTNEEMKLYIERIKEIKEFNKDKIDLERKKKMLQAQGIPDNTINEAEKVLKLYEQGESKYDEVKEIIESELEATKEILFNQYVTNEDAFRTVVAFNLNFKFCKLNEETENNLKELLKQAKKLLDKLQGSED